MAVKSKAADIPTRWRGWRDADLVADVVADLERGISAEAAAGRQGISSSAVRVWLHRFEAEARAALDAIAKGEAPQPISEFAIAVTPVARARWEWVARMEEMAIAGDPGAQWILPRRVADIYGTKQTIDLGTASPVSEVAGLLDRIAEVRASEPG